MAKAKKQMRLLYLVPSLLLLAAEFLPASMFRNSRIVGISLVIYASAVMISDGRIDDNSAATWEGGTLAFFGAAAAGAFAVICGFFNVQWRHVYALAFVGFTFLLEAAIVHLLVRLGLEDELTATSAKGKTRGNNTV